MNVYPKPCANTNCNRMMRPVTASPEDYPTAEAVHHAHGLCRACYARPYRAAQRSADATPPMRPETPLEKLEHQITVRGLNNFLARIRGTSKQKVTQ